MPEATTIEAPAQEPGKMRKTYTPSEERTVNREPPARDAAASLSVERRLIPLSLLIESPWNPRQFFPEGPMGELVESMKASGFREWLPLVVRPLPMGNGNQPVYEIGAGHRRRRAAELAGITEVPCIVKEMSDAEFLDVLNFDNSAREDVHPLHEAAGWQQWMTKTGKSVLDIAAKIGKSKEYVYVRLKFASLIDEAKRVFLNGEIGPAHASLIARLQPPEQEKALGFYRAGEWDPRASEYRRPSVRQFADFIGRDIHLQMDSACFDLASTDLLPSAGACSVCPKRTKNAPELLLQIEYVADPNRDECTDPGCFNAKVSEHLNKLQQQYESMGEKLLKISSGIIAKKGSDYGRGHFEQIANYPAAGLLAGVWMDGPNIGRLVYVKLIEQVKPEDDSAEKKRGEAERQRAQQEQIRLANQREQIAAEARKKIEEANNKRFEKERAKVELELSFRRAILDSISAKVVNVSRVDVEALLCDYLHNGEMNDEFIRVFGERFDRAGRPSLEKELAKLTDADVYRMAVLIPLFDDLDDYHLDRPAELLIAAAKRYKVDTAKIRIQIESATKKAEPAKSAAKKTAKPGARKPATQGKLGPPIKKATKKK